MGTQGVKISRSSKKSQTRQYLITWGVKVGGRSAQLEKTQRTLTESNYPSMKLTKLVKEVARKDTENFATI